MSLKDKVAIVTGGSRGIGTGIATELAKRGARVLITYQSAAKDASAVVSNIEANGGVAAAIQADCMSKDAPQIVVDAALKLGSGIDIVVNNAAFGDGLLTPEVTYEYFDKMFYTNVRFPIFLVQACIPHFNKGSRIINMSSVTAREGWPTSICYGGTKAALESATRSWARELGHKFELTSNAVNPGPVATDMWKESTHLHEKMKPYIEATPAAPRVAEIDDVCQVIGFLAEENSRWVSGNVVCANGGTLML